MPLGSQGFLPDLPGPGYAAGSRDYEERVHLLSLRPRGPRFPSRGGGARPAAV